MFMQSGPQRHVEESMRGGRQAKQVARSRHTPALESCQYGVRCCQQRTSERRERTNVWDEKEWKKCKRNLHMKVSKSPQAREGGPSIGDRLALDDSAIDGHMKMEISAEVEISQRVGGNAAPSVSIVAETSITDGWWDQAEKPWKGVGRSNEHRPGDR